MRAIDSPGVRAELRQQKRRAWAVLVCGLALFCVFVTCVGVVEGRTVGLEHVGTRASGVVVSYSPGSRVVGEAVDVEFTVAGERRVERVHLNDSSPTFERGQHVVVLVDPDDPNHFSIEGEDNLPPFVVWPMVAALIAGVIGMISGPWSLFRSRRQRLLLAAAPWRTVPVRYAEITSGNAKRGLVLVTENGTEHVVTVVSSGRWNLARSNLRDVDEAQLVGDLPGYVVLRATSGRLTSARSPFARRSERRWRRQFD